MEMLDFALSHLIHVPEGEEIVQYKELLNCFCLMELLWVGVYKHTYCFSRFRIKFYRWIAVSLFDEVWDFDHTLWRERA